MALASSLLLASTLSGVAADMPQAQGEVEEAHSGIQSFFSTTNVQLLAGDGFNLGSSDFFPGFTGENSRFIVSINHFDAWTYGDNFFFFDISHETDGSSNTEVYGEFYSFINLLAVAGYQSTGIVSGIGPMVGFNAGSSTGNNSFLAVLYGAKVNLNVPGFRSLNFQAFVYDNIDDPFNRSLDSTYQLTAVWNVPINLSDRVHLTFSGFADFIGSQDISGVPGAQLQQQFLTQPQLKLDLGNFLGL